jgi:hypothetical protein
LQSRGWPLGCFYHCARARHAAAALHSTGTVSRIFIQRETSACAPHVYLPAGLALPHSDAGVSAAVISTCSWQHTRAPTHDFSDFRAPLAFEKCNPSLSFTLMRLA